MKRFINHSVPSCPPTAYKFCPVVQYEIFFVLYSEVSTKDESVRTETRLIHSGRAGCCVIDGITKYDAFFFVLLHDKQ